MSYFDFHLHIYSKPMMAGYNLRTDNQDLSPWKNIKTKIPCEPLKRTFNSQSSYPEINAFDTSLVINCLISPDRPILLANVWIDMANFINSHPDTILKMRASAPQENVRFELEVGEKDRLLPQTQSRVAFLNSMADFQEGKINVVFALEGGHNLYVIDADDHAKLDKSFLLKLKQADPVRVLYITVTHLARWHICNHCFGMKFLENPLSKKLIRELIRPQKRGIYNPSVFMDLFETCYSTEEGHKILLDIKHMSLVSRKQFYAYRRKWLADRNAVSEDYPIIVTHAALTGIPSSDFSSRLHKKVITDSVDQETNVIVKYLRKKCMGKGNLQFYPNTINFFDDELIEIVESGGLLGLTIDKRLLGGKRTGKTIKDTEIFSRNELLELKTESGPTIFERSDEELLAMLDEEMIGVESYVDDEKFAEIVGLTYEEENWDELLEDYQEEEREEEIEDNEFYIEKTKFSINKDGQIVDPAAELGLEDNIDIDELKISLEAEWEALEILESFTVIDIDEARKLFGDLIYFGHNLLHFIEVTGKKGWNHVCIGSDFDGLVEPVKLYESVSDLKKMEIALLQLLPKMVTKSKLFVEDIHELHANIKKVLFDNGRQFLSKHY